jgi:hypothetical protein
MPCRKETPGVELYDGYLEMQKKTMISHMLPNRIEGVSTKKTHFFVF